MLVTLAAVVFISAFVLFFLSEITALYKKFLKIKGMKLLAPLFILSWLTERHQDVFISIVAFFERWFGALIERFQSVFPFLSFIEIMLLVALTCLPIWIAFCIKEFKGVIYDFLPYAYRLSAILWVILASFIVQFNTP